MATEVAALVARLEADTRDFQKGIKGAEKRLQKLEGEGRKTRKGLGQTESSMGKLTKSVKGFAIAAGVAFGAKVVGDFFKSSISAASDLGESINAVEVVFGDAAEGIKQLGVEAATAVGLSNAEFNSLAVGFSAFVEKIAVGGDSVVDVMAELTGRASDFASVMNIEVAQAATIFQSGLAGETEPLRKFGIDLSAAAVTAEALALGLAGSSAELTEQDKILARFELLMRQTNKTAGDFANTSDSLANKQRIFTAELENAKAELGESLIPAMEALLGIGMKLLPVLGTLGNILGTLTGTLDVAAQAFKNFAKERGREVKTTEDMVVAISDEADARRNWADFLLFGIGPLEATTRALREHLQATELSADELEEFRVEIAALGEDNKLTAEQVEFLNDILDDQAGVLGNEVLKATQDVRDAVLDGAAAADTATTAAKKNTTALKETVTAMRDLRSAFLEAADPIFAVKGALNRASEAQEIYDEFLAEGTLLTSEGIDAAFDLAAANTDLEESFRALAGGDVQKGIEQIARQLGISVVAAREFLVEAGIIEGLDIEVTIQLNLDKGQFLKDLNDIPVIPGAVLVPRQPPPLVSHSGGVVPGPPGADVPAVLQAGQTVRTVSQERGLQTGGGVTVVVNGFVGSELQLAAQIDKLLTRRSKTSKLGF